jgi:hypothetical protein
LDPTDRFHAEIGVHINENFPTDFGKNSWKNGLSLALDPYHLDEQTILKVYPTIFSLHFVCPTDTVEVASVQSLVDKLVASNPLIASITYKATEKTRGETEKTKGQSSLIALDSPVAFGREASDLYLFAARSADVSFTLSLTFPFKCPDRTRDAKLKDLGDKLFRRSLSLKEVATVFERGFSLPSESTGGFPRATNSFRAKFGFFRTADDEARHIFTELCLMHLRFRKRLMDCDADKNCRLSSLSFSFYTDKNPRRTTPFPPWILEAADSIKEQHPKLFESEEPSAEVQPSGVNTLLPGSPATAASTSAQDGSTSAPPAPNGAISCTPTTSASADATKDNLPQVQDYAVHILSSEDMATTTSFRFILEDYGQYANIEREGLSKREGNCCLFLCLAASRPSLSPSSLAAYFHMRACQLQSDNALYNKHGELQTQWQLRTAARPSLASVFPADTGGQWAGTHRTGRIIDMMHLLLLAPSEIRNSPLLVIRDDGSKSEINIPQEEIANHIAYFPAALNLPLAPIFLRFKGNHYTLLRPAQANTAHDILSGITEMLPIGAVHSYIQIDPDNSMANLLSIASSHLELDDLRITHDLQTRATSELFERTLSQSMAHASHLQEVVVLDSSVTSDDDGDDLLGSPMQRSPSPGDDDSPHKAPHIGSTPPRGGTTGHTSRRLSFSDPAPLSSPVPSEVSALSSQASNISLHSTASSAVSSSVISNVSNIDLGNYVRMQGRAGESKLRATIDVVGGASADESSEVTGSGWQSSQRTSSVSQTASLYSTGSLHSHAIPSKHDVPKCKCTRSMRFFCYHESNHSCDGTGCAKPIPAGAYGWHCADCSVDLCTDCFPINFSPVNSFVDSQSSAFSINASPPKGDRAALRLQEGDVAAASRLGAQ